MPLGRKAKILEVARRGLCTGVLVELTSEREWKLVKGERLVLEEPHNTLLKTWKDALGKDEPWATPRAENMFSGIGPQRFGNVRVIDHELSSSSAHISKVTTAGPRYCQELTDVQRSESWRRHQCQGTSSRNRFHRFMQQRKRRPSAGGCGGPTW